MEMKWKKLKNSNRSITINSILFQNICDVISEFEKFLIFILLYFIF